MPKYLFQATHTTPGVQKLLTEGGSSRQEEFERLAAEQGGTLESFYYAFGTTDLFMVFNLPDAATAAAMSMNISSAGALTLTTTQLITPKEIDVASAKTVTSRPPGNRPTMPPVEND